MPESFHTQRRAAIIAGLRELADWLEANPEVPAASVEMIPHIRIYEDTAGRAEVHRLAALTDAPITDRGDRLSADRQFGPAVKWQALYIDQAVMDKWHALTSYTGAVHPEVTR